MSHQSPYNPTPSSSHNTRFERCDGDVCAALSQGGVAVVPTDTLYGLAAHALDEEAVERVYGIKQRAGDKPVIVLIRHADDLHPFGVVPSDKQFRIMNQVWPGPTTIVFPTMTPRQYAHIHRGVNRIGFRIPADEDLQEMIRHTGPLIAPSANPEDAPPATTVEKAREYFGDTVDLYIDHGELAGEASRVLDVTNDVVTTLRGEPLAAHTYEQSL